MKYLKMKGLLVLFLFAFACESTENQAEVQQSNAYKLVASDTKLQWTAFKTMEKVAVSGTFDDVKILDAQISEDPLQVLKGAKFSINTETTNSANPDRDDKIMRLFFGNLKFSNQITGVVESFDALEQTVTVRLVLNDKEQTVIGNYQWLEPTLSLQFNLDLSIFEALPALAKLNEACHSLHQGADGSSKLWQEVEIFVQTTLLK